MVDWRIYYHDGSTFDSDDGVPDAAPAYGVIFVLQKVPWGRSTRNEIIGWIDFYYFVTGDRWYGSDHYGLRERLRDRDSLEGVCQGRILDFETFNDIGSAAKTDPDFPDLVG